MPSVHCTDLVVLKRHRIRSSNNEDHVIFENTTSEVSRPVRTSYLKNRRATLVGIPPSLINISTQDLQQNLNVQTTVFFYNGEAFQEVCYRSIEDIRAVDDNECLWIDVTGVSLEEDRE
jgi:hypothetical protein